MENWLNYPHGHIEMSIMSFISHKLLKKKKSEFKEHSEFRIDQILIYLGNFFSQTFKLANQGEC